MGSENGEIPREPQPPGQRSWEPQARPVPWMPGPMAWRIEQVRDREGKPAYVLTFDTPNNRTVALVTPEEAERFARGVLGVIGKAPDGLVLADMDDLRKLRGQP